MKRQSTSKTLLAGAAVAGLLTGGFAQLHAATTTTPVNSTVTAAGFLAADSKDVHDCAGKNTCKGKGGCKTGDNGCKGKNSCKGKGGCATDKKK
jgi:hypothetical protein